MPQRQADVAGRVDAARSAERLAADEPLTHLAGPATRARRLLSRTLADPDLRDAPAPTHPDPDAAITAAVAALPLPDGDGQWTCHTATVAWLRARRSLHTRRAYFRDLADWLAWLQGRGLDPRAAHRGDVDTWLAEQANGRRPPAAATVARRLSTLSSWYAYLFEHDLVRTNPAATVDRPAVDRDFSPTVGVTVAEVRALLAAADGADDAYFAVRNRVLVGFLAGLGLRVGEAIAVDLADLRTNHGHRTVVVRGKGGRTRELPIRPALVRHLDPLVNQRRRALAEPVVHREAERLFRDRLEHERRQLRTDLIRGVRPRRAVERGFNPARRPLSRRVHRPGAALGAGIQAVRRPAAQPRGPGSPHRVRAAVRHQQRPPAQPGIRVPARAPPRPRRAPTGRRPDQPAQPAPRRRHRCS